MQDRQTAAIDLPVKALAWEDADGRVWLAPTNDAAWIAQRHGLRRAEPSGGRGDCGGHGGTDQGRYDATKLEPRVGDAAAVLAEVIEAFKDLRATSCATRVEGFSKPCVLSAGPTRIADAKKGNRMVNVVMLLLSLLLPLIHLAVGKGPWLRRNVLRIFLIYAFVFDVGAVGFLFGFVPHVFFADQAAELIGWPTGSMFQFEVGLHDGAWVILGFLCVFFGGGFCWRRPSAGRSSCSGPPGATSTRYSSTTTTRLTTSSRRSPIP